MDFNETEKVETTLREDVDNLYGRCVSLIEKAFIENSEYDSWSSFMKSDSYAYKEYVEFMDLMDDARLVARKEASALDEILSYVREQKAKESEKKK